MARVSTLNENGGVRVCKTVKFEKSLLWRKMLGRIPSKVKEAEAVEGADPESEYILQRLVELHPDVLPWHEFCDSPSEKEVQVCVICERTTSAETDVLILERTVTGTGRFVIVETKLVKNPEIYRAVLGQVLEYAAKLSADETPATLEEKAIAYWRTRGSKFGGDFQNQMKTLFGPGWRKTVWKSACENLQRGNVRLLIVSDRLPEDLRLAVTFLSSNVLLSAVEVQAHETIEKHGKPVVTAASSAFASGPDTLRSTAQRYFSEIRLSLGTLQVAETGQIVAEVHDRGKPTLPRVRRPYSSHLEELGGSETVPGKILEILREKTLQTERGYVDEGETFLTFRLWGLPGLNVREDKGELYIQFWSYTALGGKRSEEALKIFRTVFHPRKDKEHFYNTPKWGFYLHPINISSSEGESKRLVQLLEKVFDKLHSVK
jgi:hypothetical protein